MDEQAFRRERLLASGLLRGVGQPEPVPSSRRMEEKPASGIERPGKVLNEATTSESRRSQVPASHH